MNNAKKLLFGAGMFLLGIAAAAIVVATPLASPWLERLRNLLPSSVSVSAEAASQTPDEHGAARKARKVKYWRAPMDPTYIRDKPGKSPMGMDLIPVYEDEDEAPPPGTVSIDPTFVQNIGVQSEVVRRADIPFTIRTVGTFTYDDSQAVLVNTKFEGWIERVAVNYVGEPVRKGQRLFDVYSPQLVTTQNEYLQAVDYATRMADAKYADAAARARSLVESARQRLKYWDISDQQIEELQRSRMVRRTLSVVSPVAGIVAAKMDQALEGMFVNAGMNLYKLVNLSRIWVEAEVYEHQLPWLKIGQRAWVELPQAGGRRLAGHVRYIYPFFNDRTRTMKVSIELPNPGQKLRADMYANVTFETPSARNVVAVPEEAVIHSGERSLIVLDRGNGTFQVREAKLGVNGGGLWEVKDGVEAGDRVVVSAQFLIDSESSLKEAIRKLTSSGGASPMEGVDRSPEPAPSAPAVMDPSPHQH